MDTLSLSKDEAQCLYETIEELSGGNPENVFNWDGSDDLSDTLTRAFAKLFQFCGEDIPDELSRHMDDAFGRWTKGGQWLI